MKIYTESFYNTVQMRWVRWEIFLGRAFSFRCFFGNGKNTWKFNEELC